MQPPVQEHVALSSLHTFGLKVQTRFFITIKSLPELSAALKWQQSAHPELPTLILGEGSNLLFTQDFPGIIFKINLEGKKVIEEAENWVHIKVQAGETWQRFVDWTVENNWWGLENLSLIPGSCGAAPIQNIGAYGTELKDSLVEVTALNRHSLELEVFQKNDCRFGYRDSIFKQKANQWIITDLTLQLSKIPQPHLEYSALQNHLNSQQITEPSQRQIADAVCNIRRSKLPNPKVLGSAGSFFKNPVISRTQLREIESQHGTLKHFPVDEESVKIPAALLIQSCGWKGFRQGDAGVHRDQSLVLVNYGQAEGRQLKNLAEQIIDSVQAKFGITLEPEVRII